MVKTAEQRELLQRGRVRVTLTTRRATRVRVRAALAPAAGAQSIPLADRVVRAGTDGLDDVDLPLSLDGRRAAASCTPLFLIVRAPGAPPSTRRLKADRRRCPRNAHGRPQRRRGRPWIPATTPTVDPRQQTALAFGDRSHWLQPWKAYMETPPVTRLLDAPE